MPTRVQAAARLLCTLAMLAVTASLGAEAGDTSAAAALSAAERGELARESRRLLGGKDGKGRGRRDDDDDDDDKRKRPSTRGPLQVSGAGRCWHVSLFDAALPPTALCRSPAGPPAVPRLPAAACIAHLACPLAPSHHPAQAAVVGTTDLLFNGSAQPFVAADSSFVNKYGYYRVLRVFLDPACAGATTDCNASSFPYTTWCVAACQRLPPALAARRHVAPAARIEAASVSAGAPFAAGT